MKRLTKSPSRKGGQTAAISAPSNDPHDTGILSIDVARRLILSRVIIGGRAEPGANDYALINQKEFGAKADFSQPRYQQYESGKRLIPVEAALSICAVYSLTLDWLYMGEPSGLPQRLHHSLHALDRDLPKRINEDLLEKAQRRSEKARKKPKARAP